MNITDKLFALRATPPFDALRDSEQILIAQVCRERSYGPGEAIFWEGQVLHRLCIVVMGRVEYEDGREAARLLGLPSLIAEKPAETTAVAAKPRGATLLFIEKGHFFTILNECPSIAVGLLETSHDETLPGIDS